MQDKYFLRHGKLQLSMLDEDIEDVEVKAHDQETIHYIKLEQDALEEYLKGEEYEVNYEEDYEEYYQEDYNQELEGQEQELREPKIKVSEEIYDTLKAMGEFLTQDPEGESLEEQDDEKIEGLQLVQEKEEVKTKEEDEVPYKKHLESQECDENTSMSQSKIDEIINTHLGEVKPQFKYAKELKQKVESRINWIKSYGENK